MSRVSANLLVGANGMTTLNGSSRPLSNSADRERFHALRKSAVAIAIGGSTFRSEPYSSSPVPLYVATRRADLKGMNVRFFNLSPAALISLALSEIQGELLVEGGVNFLAELIECELIDQLNITRVKKDGDDFPFDEGHLRKHYRVDFSENSGDTLFELWLPNKI